EIRDETIPEGTLLLTIKDDLCREFIVSGNRSLVQWVDEHIVSQLKPLGFDLQEPKVIQTRHGEAVSLRYRVRAGAPCVESTVKDGRRIETKPDADVGLVHSSPWRNDLSIDLCHGRKAGRACFLAHSVVRKTGSRRRSAGRVRGRLRFASVGTE
ncbi:MAG: hypothetical protein ACREQK_11975, partial [Candidatus Binatia bacterium]